MAWHLQCSCFSSREGGVLSEQPDTQKEDTKLLTNLNLLQEEQQKEHQIQAHEDKKTPPVWGLFIRRSQMTALWPCEGL